jgi:hypothetical protein
LRLSSFELGILTEQGEDPIHIPLVPCLAVALEDRVHSTPICSTANHLGIYREGPLDASIRSFRPRDRVAFLCNGVSVAQTWSLAPSSPSACPSSRPRRHVIDLLALSHHNLGLVITLLLHMLRLLPFLVSATANSPSRIWPCASSSPSTSERLPGQGLRAPTAS